MNGDVNAWKATDRTLRLNKPVPPNETDCQPFRDQSMIPR